MIKSLWSEDVARECKDDLDLRVYTSRLLGADPTLVLHGGGNTSVKIKENGEEILYVKGSGWNLETIEREGFAPVRMDTLLGLAELKSLSDLDMVESQKEAMTNKNAPNPSVEAILHAIIPFKFVDHTHSDVIITITNTPNGDEKIREIYGDEVLVIPYVMPGFILAKEIKEITKNVDWSKYRGMVLLSHGLFSFDDDAKKSYEKSIDLVREAEEYLKSKKIELNIPNLSKSQKGEMVEDFKECFSSPTEIMLNSSSLAKFYSQQEDLESFATKGPLTPDHVIRTKKEPMIFDGEKKEEFCEAIKKYIKGYEEYFDRNAKSHHKMLDPYPKWAIWKGEGVLVFGKDQKECEIINDIIEHTIESILKANALGGWRALSESDIFEMEYWELEQAKLKRGK